MTKRIDPGHTSARSFFRVVGPCLMLVGLILIVIGVQSFFSGMGEFRSDVRTRVHSPGQGFRQISSPAGTDRFWCVFAGMPLLMAGIFLCKLGYMGKMARYVAGEVAPVGKDTFNYLAHGTKGAVGELAAAVGQGLREGPTPAAQEATHCPKCNAENEPDANFCNDCGQALPVSKACSACSEMNDADARFCDNCGKSLA